MSSWPPEIEREWGLSEVPPCIEVPSQGMTSFSFHVEALGYILCLFRGCPPPPPSQPRQGPQTGLTLSLSLATMSSPAPPHLLNNIL